MSRLATAASVVSAMVLLSASASATPSKARGPFLLVSLPTLGTVTWSCDPSKNPYWSLGFNASSGANDSVRFHVGSRTIVSRTLRSGQSIQFPRVDSEVEQVDVVDRSVKTGLLRAYVKVDFVIGNYSYCWPYLPPRLVVHLLPR
jgi:hypothetical protein